MIPPGSDSCSPFVTTPRSGRDDLVRHLNDRRIGTRLLFGGNLVRQPYMKDRNVRTHGSLANSDRIMNQTFWIGVYPGLGEDHVGYVLDVIGRVLPCAGPVTRW